MNTSADILTERAPLAAIADRLGRSYTWLRYVRNGDARFPNPDAQGLYPLVAVVALVHLRSLERMSDVAFQNDECARRRALLKAMLPGGLLDFVKAEARARVETLPMQTLCEAIDEAEQFLNAQTQ